MKKVSKEKKWQDKWYRYVEFLRREGRRPDYYDINENESLYQWFENNAKKIGKGKLTDSQYVLFGKLRNDGDIYDFYVTNRYENLKRLQKLGFEEEGEYNNLIDEDFQKVCLYYKDFCFRMMRHPWARKPEEVNLAKWYTKNEEAYENSSLTETQMQLFKNLRDNVKEIMNYASPKDNSIIGSNLPVLGEDVTVVNQVKENLSQEESESVTYPTVRDARWYGMYHKYINYIKDNGYVPTQTKDSRLYHWIYRQDILYKNGEFSGKKKQDIKKLLDKVSDIKDEREKEQLAERKKRKEEVKANKTKSKRPISINAPDKPTKQDELWDSKWQAYMDYMDKNKRRPSKHHAEDMVLFDWFKHNKKMLNQGKLREDRVGKFKQLLGEAKDFQRVNQHNYVNPELKVEEPAIHLYDYQADMKKMIEDNFLKVSSIMVQMPTGTGKTHVIASVVRDFVRDGMGRVWVVAHRRELVSQIKHTLAVYLTKNEMHHIRATSIQWLINHYKELNEEPGLIVIDEAHHAIAKTYAQVMGAYPFAKKLGVTATPYRLSGAGFTDLFKILLTSWSIKTFIQKGYLSSFDYYCISKNSVEKFRVDGLKKRGTDGDYQTKELNENFNQSQIISRLFETYQKYAPGKRGFIYAISIDHAENIAKYYREHGVSSVAVSSKTPEMERAKAIQDFKDGKITTLCSVDLFSEGFDAPDAEFIQLARPTLSLAKYLQMVGRGLRTAKGKKACIILDNVGLKDKFGLPSRDRNWDWYFNGDWKARRRKKDKDEEDIGVIERVLGDLVGPESNEQMVLETSYGVLKAEEKFVKQFKVAKAINGLQGINTIDDRPVIKCVYDHVAINEYGIAGLKRGKITEWYDLRNGLLYDRLPEVGYVGSIPIAYIDRKFYPRLRSQWITPNNFIPVNIMRRQFGNGLDWDNRFINWEGKPKVYKVVDFYSFGVRMLRDEAGKRYVQRNPKSKLISMNYIKDFDKWVEKRKSEYEEFVKKAKGFPIEYVDIDMDKLQAENERVWKDEYGIITVIENSGKQYWIDSHTKRKYDKRPVCKQRGDAQLLYIDDFVFVRNLEAHELPYQDWQIKSDGVSISITNEEY